MEWSNSNQCPNPNCGWWGAYVNGHWVCQECGLVWAVTAQSEGKEQQDEEHDQNRHGDQNLA